MRTNRDAVFEQRGWTPVPNHVFELMPQLDPIQFKIFMFIVRGLYGWDTPRDEFSVRFISNGTGIARSTVHRHIRKMVSAQLLFRLGRGKKGATRFSISEFSGSSTVPSGKNTSVPLRAVHNPSRLPGQNKDTKKNSTKKQASTLNPSRTSSDLLSGLEKTLSRNTFSAIKRAYLGQKNSIHFFRTDLPDHLQFILKRLPDVSFEVSPDCEPLPDSSSASFPRGGFLYASSL